MQNMRCCHVSFFSYCNYFIVFNSGMTSNLRQLCQLWFEPDDTHRNWECRAWRSGQIHSECFWMVTGSKWMSEWRIWLGPGGSIFVSLAFPLFHFSRSWDMFQNMFSEIMIPKWFIVQGFSAWWCCFPGLERRSSMTSEDDQAEMVGASGAPGSG